MYDVPASKLNPITPELRGGRHVLAWDDVSFEVDARTGGRVTALRLGGRNLLTGPEIDELPAPVMASGPLKTEISPKATLAPLATDSIE